jgi:hypothetical protein
MVSVATTKCYVENSSSGTNLGKHSELPKNILGLYAVVQTAALAPAIRCKSATTPAAQGFSGLSAAVRQPVGFSHLLHQKRPFLQHREFLNHNGTATQSHTTLCISVSIRASVVF